MKQLAFMGIGYVLWVTMADDAAHIELNAMEPVMAQCCFESAELLVNGFDTLRIRCVEGITANEEKCLQNVPPRPGAAPAQGRGLAPDPPLAAVPTAEALAYNLYGCEQLICPMMDARRNQVYAGVYRVGDMLLECVTGQKAVSIEDYIAELNDLGDPVTVLGDGVPVHREALQQGLNVSWKEAPAHMNRQSAASVAVLGARYYDEGKIVSAEAFRPDYLRKSQAEREREARLAAGEKHDRDE